MPIYESTSYHIWTSHQSIIVRSQKAHPPNNGWSDAFGIQHCFIGRHIVGQIVLMDTTKRAQECAQSRACSFTTVAMHLANAIPIVIARPLLDAVADTCVMCMHTHIIGGLVCVEDRTLWRHLSQPDWLQLKRHTQLL